jgi:hypothetical protein
MKSSPFYAGKTSYDIAACVAEVINNAFGPFGQQAVDRPRARRCRINDFDIRHRIMLAQNEIDVLQGIEGLPFLPVTKTVQEFQGNGRILYGKAKMMELQTELL